MSEFEERLYVACPEDAVTYVDLQGRPTGFGSDYLPADGEEDFCRKSEDRGSFVDNRHLDILQKAGDLTFQGLKLRNVE